MDLDNKMFTIKQPNEIIFGVNTAKNYSFSNKSLIITSKGSEKRGWLEYLGINDFFIYDNVVSNPPITITDNIISEFKDEEIDCVIGIGGGSSMDVAKFVGHKLKKKKILIPTTFGSGSEVTRIAVLTVNGKKTSFHDDQMFADIAIVDPYFIKNTPEKIIKDSAIDACAQCSEAYDSKNGNEYTRFLCKNAFSILEDAIINNKYERLPLGSLITGLGFGNSSTTLGHALSYVFSNEGYSHGHALAFTTLAAHKFNESVFEKRFERIVKKLKFERIFLKEELENVVETILSDKKHLDNNPKLVSSEDIKHILKDFKM